MTRGQSAAQRELRPLSSSNREDTVLSTTPNLWHPASCTVFEAIRLTQSDWLQRALRFDEAFASVADFELNRQRAPSCHPVDIDYGS